MLFYVGSDPEFHRGFMSGVPRTIAEAGLVDRAGARHAGIEVKIAKARIHNVFVIGLELGKLANQSVGEVTAPRLARTGLAYVKTDLHRSPAECVRDPRERRSPHIRRYFRIPIHGCHERAQSELECI